jgi:hypothetical protein
VSNPYIKLNAYSVDERRGVQGHIKALNDVVGGDILALIVITPADELHVVAPERLTLTTLRLLRDMPCERLVRLAEEHIA